MNLEHIPQSIQLALALIGSYYLLDKTWVALTTFYFQRKMMLRQNAAQETPFSPTSPEFERQEIERLRKQTQYDYTNAILQLMRVEGYTLPIAQNAALEIFDFAKGKAEEKHPI